MSGGSAEELSQAGAGSQPAAPVYMKGVAPRDDCGSHGSSPAVMVMAAGARRAAKGSLGFTVHSRSNLILFFILISLPC